MSEQASPSQQAPQISPAVVITEQHRGFLKRLENSMKAVFAVAKYLHKQGNGIHIPRVRMAPSADAADGYADDGDILLDDGTIIDVKGLNSVFSTPDTWLWPDFFFSNVKAYEARRLRKTEADTYFVVSADLRYAVRIDKDTRPFWHIVEGRVRNTGNVERNYACPKDEVVWLRLD